MADIINIKKDGVTQYPITKPECVIDENGKNVLQLIRENAGGESYDDTELRQEVAELSERIDEVSEGVVGPQGPQGPQGEAGIQGEKGDCNFTIGNGSPIKNGDKNDIYLDLSSGIFYRFVKS